MSDRPKEEQADLEASSSINVKIGDAELKGAYSNLLRITHTREEFILDFINVVPPQGIVSARIVTSPGASQADHPRPGHEPAALRGSPRRDRGGARAHGPVRPRQLSGRPGPPGDRPDRRRIDWTAGGPAGPPAQPTRWLLRYIEAIRSR